MITRNQKVQHQNRNVNKIWMIRSLSAISEQAIEEIVETRKEYYSNNKKRSNGIFIII